MCWPQPLQFTIPVGSDAGAFLLTRGPPCAGRLSARTTSEGPSPDVTHLPVQKRMLRVRPSSRVFAQRPSRSANTRRSLLR